MVKRIFTVLVAILLLIALSVTAFASAMPDLSEEGSLTFVMRWMGMKLDGGRLNLYKVGEVSVEKGD